MMYEKATVEQDISADAMPEITRAESRLAEAIGSLICNLEDLEKRLERVLRPPMPSDPSDNMLAEVRPATSQLTDFLNAQASRAEAQSAQVADLLRRLAL